jgi:hypothetical protein
MRWAGIVARMEEKGDAYRVLVGKSEEQKSLGRRKLRWEDNIKMKLQEIRWGRGLDLA